jgi:hypothetical protein
MVTALRLSHEDLFLRYQLRAAQGLEQAEALFIVALMIQQDHPDFGHDVGMIAASILAQSNQMLDEVEMLFLVEAGAHYGPVEGVALEERSAQGPV